MADELRLSIRLEDLDDYVTAKEAAETHGVELDASQVPPPEEFLDPVTAVLIGGAVLGLGRAIYGWWDRRRGGLVIDLRPTAPDNLYRDRDVPWGHIVMFANDGKVSIETKDEPKDAVERLLEALIKAPFDSATEVGKAAVAVLGDGKTDKVTISTDV